MTSDDCQTHKAQFGPVFAKAISNAEHSEMSFRIGQVFTVYPGVEEVDCIDGVFRFDGCFHTEGLRNGELGSQHWCSISDLIKALEWVKEMAAKCGVEVD